ncbi:MAG: type IX secretion system sortase PorU [Saprospiraceae bacterium]|nr:type IX secretion system sortase PorU [Saprospiraceae bacterium]MCB0678752.1 type IX secretion system sortase PorU [Saprospiraceae bacterium]MCB0679498.1 type IX secretion system sortase PorU [Saprospiraceae bacterium]
MKTILTSVVLFSLLTSAFAGNPTRIGQTLQWEDQPVIHTDLNGQAAVAIWRFEGAFYDESHPTLPYFYHRFPVDGPGQLQVRLLEAQYEPLPKEPSADDSQLDRDLQFQTHVSRDRRRHVGSVRFIPIRRTATGSYEKLVSFELEITFTPAPAGLANNRGGDFTYTSVLQDGQIYKLAVTADGIYRLDYDFVVNQLGLDPAGVDPRRFQLYGNGGAMLPELASATRIDDLEENHILVAGEDDGSFDPGDYLLFYGQGPGQWIYNGDAQVFDFQPNVYDTRSYYFLKIGSENGLRIPDQASINTAYTTTTFNDFHRLEDDRVNLLNEYELGQGSGMMWFGDYFKNQRSYTYPGAFSFPNLVKNSPVVVKAQFAARADKSTTRFNVVVDGQTLNSDAFEGLNLGNPNGSFASLRQLNGTATATDDDLSVTVDYPSVPGATSEGWLDYVQINARRELRMTGEQLIFRDIETLAQPSATFQLADAGNDITVWDITDPLHPKRQDGSLNGSTFNFGVVTDQLKTFIAFRQNGSALQAEAIGPAPNQNLHGIDEVDMVILYHEDFEAEAQRLADHRSQHNDMEVALVRIDRLFNEFSSGGQDATAIRDFCKMLYERSDRFRFLLLFGDGSYDHRNLDGQNNNFVTTYQTSNSVNPILSFPSDDYFGLLDDDEGILNTNDDLDIAIGRLPVRTVEQAADVVDKIINYDSNPSTLGDWRNRVVFVGDDEDQGIHTRDADNIADDVNEKYSFLNVDKIYVDAFNQVSTPGGERVPTATEALNTNLFKGVLAVTYLGHGGAKGWAQERILQIPDINGWTNFDQLPIFITATCSFAGYDDPGFTTAGELVLLNKRGGAIGLYTTVRAVYASTNETLTRAAADTLFAKVDGHGQELGEALRVAKNKANGGSNSRKFTLLGDPSLQLALPHLEIATTRINGIEVGSGQLDTLRALQKVTVEGEVRGQDGQLMTGFNGTLSPTIFDKRVTYKTLGQDNTPVRNYTLQKNTLFKGRASVQGGKFQFTFVVPKDINFNYGYGKISYYAEEGNEIDGGGAFEGVIIGGTDANALADDQGPKVDVFMNSIDFVFGGLTSDNPTLLVKLEDDNGINVVGNSIGHDLTAVLDEQTQGTILLNDFYEAELDDYTRGEARYPLSELADGRHTVKVRAFDVANNSAEGYTEFVVASSAEVALDHVLNYPNPFINSTCFQFEHNLDGQDVDVLIRIYTVSGRLVKTIEERIFSEGSRLSLDNCIQWDGKDDYGDPLAKGVYLYQVKVRSANAGALSLEGESGFEKLVILR